MPLLLLGALIAGPKIKKLATTHPVSFKKKKKVRKPVKVGFKTKSGEAVSFSARKTVTEEVPVRFRASNTKKPARKPAKKKAKTKK